MKTRSARKNDTQMRPCVMLVILSLVASAEELAADADSDSDDEALASSLAAALPKPEESDAFLASFKALRKKHGSSTSRP